MACTRYGCHVVEHADRKGERNDVGNILVDRLPWLRLFNLYSHSDLLLDFFGSRSPQLKHD